MIIIIIHKLLIRKEYNSAVLCLGYLGWWLDPDQCRPVWAEHRQWITILESTFGAGKHQSWVIVICLAILIFNRYLNNSEYYHDSETNIWIQIPSFFHLWQRNVYTPKYSYIPLIELSNTKTCSSLLKLISQELFLTIFFGFFLCSCGYVQARQCQMHMPITTCLLSQQQFLAIAVMIHTDTHTHRHRHIDTHTHRHRHTDTDTHRHRHTYTQTQTHIHIYTQTQTHTIIP